MWEFLHFLLGYFALPAIVSFVITLWLNRIMEARRARRDNITRLFADARDDVRRSVEVAMDYFAAKPVNRTALQEAKVIGAEREVRFAVSLLLGTNYPGCETANETAQIGFETFLTELTGGNFQSKTGRVAKEHLVRLVHAGAGMRTALARLRDAELRERSAQDPAARLIEKIVNYMKGFPNGPY